MSLKKDNFIENLVYLGIGAVANTYAMQKLKLTTEKSKIITMLVSSGIYYVESTIYDALNPFAEQNTDLSGKLEDEVTDL